jgi:hypothetical protein
VTVAFPSATFIDKGGMAKCWICSTNSGTEPSKWLKRQFIAGQRNFLKKVLAPLVRGWGHSSQPSHSIFLVMLNILNCRLEQFFGDLAWTVNSAVSAMTEAFSNALGWILFTDMVSNTLPFLFRF